MEALVLKRLQGISQVCQFISCGKTERANCLVMTLLGPNLSELRKKQIGQKFSISTVLRLGVQIIKVIQSMHNCGFLHRDLKPSNFAMGTGENARTCFLLDFGLSRQYIMPTGELKPPRGTTGFRGTVRYASLNAHSACDLGRHDDLWSVFYMLVELANGHLPWKTLREKDDVHEAKLHCDHKKLVTDLPEEFNLYLDHLQQLSYYDKPNYAYLVELFEVAQKNLGINETDPFDWEQQTVTKQVITEMKGKDNGCLNHYGLQASNKEKETDKVAIVSEGAGDNQLGSIQEDRPLLCDTMSSSSSTKTNEKQETKKPELYIQHNIFEKTTDSEIGTHERLQYTIPLPPEPKPTRYICTRARKYVKCRQPHTLFSDC